MDLLWRVIYIICLFLTLCTSQLTSSPCSDCSAIPTCRGCNVNADVITTSSTSWSVDVNNPESFPTPILLASLVFTGYSVISTSSMTGKCITYTSSPISLITPKIYPVSDYGIPLSEVTFEEDYLNEMYSGFLNDTYSSFYGSLGLGGCTSTLPLSQVFPTFQGRLAPTSATALPTATPTEDSVPVRNSHSTRIIVISTLLPTLGLAILLFSFILLRRYRRKRRQADLTNEPKSTSNTQLYVDQKAELEDEERGKQEMDGEGIRHEMEAVDRMFEMPGDGHVGTCPALFTMTQELRGVEYSQELEVPGNAT